MLTEHDMVKTTNTLGDWNQKFWADTVQNTNGNDYSSWINIYAPEEFIQMFTTTETKTSKEQLKEYINVLDDIEKVDTKSRELKHYIRIIKDVLLKKLGEEAMKE